MDNIKFARIDDRLVHGQVVTAWSNSVGIDSIYVIDDKTAKDDFMKMLYTSLQNNYSFKIKVFSVDDLMTTYNGEGFGNDKVMLLFKDIDHAYRAFSKGVKLPVLNVGNIPKKADNKVITDYVALNEADYNKLNEIAESDVDVYFQAMPSMAKKKFKEVKW